MALDAVSILVSVMLRKSIYIFQEFALLSMDFFPVLVSAIRFSRFIFRRTAAVSNMRYSTMSSMVVRHDR